MLSIEEQIKIIKKVLKREEVGFWSQAEADAKRQSRVFSWDDGIESEHAK